MIQFRNIPRTDLANLSSSISFSFPEQTYFRIVFYKVNSFHNASDYETKAGLQPEATFFPKYIDQNKQTNKTPKYVGQVSTETTDAPPASLNRKEFSVGISGDLRTVKKTVGTGASSRSLQSSLQHGLRTTHTATPGSCACLGLRHRSFRRVSQPVFL